MGRDARHREHVCSMQQVQPAPQYKLQSLGPWKQALVSLAKGEPCGLGASLNPLDVAL